MKQIKIHHILIDNAIEEGQRGEEQYRYYRHLCDIAGIEPLSYRKFDDQRLNVVAGYRARRERFQSNMNMEEKMKEALRPVVRELFNEMIKEIIEGIKNGTDGTI